MACNDKNKFRTAEAATKASLRTKGAIDKFLNILDIAKFRKLTKEWTEDAKKRFGITGNLFYEENNKAIPNKEAFEQIDNAKGIFYQLPINNKELTTDVIFYPQQFVTIAYDSNIKSWIIKQDEDSAIGGETSFKKDNWTYYYAPWLDDPYSKQKIEKGNVISEQISKEEYEKERGLLDDNIFSPKLISFDEAKKYYEDYKKHIQQLDSNYLFQNNELQSSKASEETLDIVKEAAKNMGINIQDLADYVKGNPEVNGKDINGLTDLVKGTIAISLGMESQALTEEVIHIATAILEQTNPKLITELISKIDRFKIYQQTFDVYKNLKAYQLPNGKPNIRKIKKEAVDKLLAEVVIYESEGSTDFPELMKEADRSFVKKWWEMILDFLRGVYRKTNIDIFRDASYKALFTEGKVTDIKTDGIYFQTGNKAVDDIYNKIVDFDSRMELIPQVLDNQGEVLRKRHYTLDDVEIEKSVTEKIKGKNTMAKRTEDQQTFDNQKKEWGSEGHRYMEQYIMANLIDKNGYALPAPEENVIDSPLDDKLTSIIETFAKELIYSYPENTRFLIERKVVNEKVKGKLASTVDFLAIQPVGDNDFKIDILDWKFTGVNTNTNDDIPWYKQTEWKEQMGEYSNILSNYGVERKQIRKARMIPFIMNYENSIREDKKSPLVPKSIEVGNIDSLKETKMYLLPVAVNSESTGNPKIDALINSLREQWDKLYKTSVSPEDRFSKIVKVNQLSKAIRNLHLRLNFFPLYDIADTFLRNAKREVDSFDNVNYDTISKEELTAKLNDLLEYQRSAEKFINLDEIYLSHISREDMDKKEENLLKDFERVSASTKRMLIAINKIQQDYLIHLGIKEGIVTEKTADQITNPEREITALSKSFLEGSKLSSTIIQLASRIIKVSQSLVDLNFNKVSNNYKTIVLALEKEAQLKNKRAFDMIGTLTSRGPRLIKKLDSNFLKEIKEAKEKGNKDFLIKNMDFNKYKSLINPAIEKSIEELKRTQFSSEEEEDMRIRESKIRDLKNSLDISLDTFDGYNKYIFNYYYRQAMIEEGHYSNEFNEMRQSENALKVWQFFTDLNEKAKQMGYIEKQGMSFFPLVEATTLQKMVQSGKVIGEIKDFFRDMYTINPNEEQSYSKIDDETGKIKKLIPKYFVRTNKTVDQLSVDLNKVGLLWIKSLLEYESARNIEDSLLTMYSVEKQKGSLIVDSKGEIIFDGIDPRINEKENKNADVLEVIINDALYGITENLNSLGNTLTSATATKLSKNEEEAEMRAISAKKLLKNGDVLVRTLALGLKPLVGIANWTGTQFQSFISSRNFYTFSEFEKNNYKVTTGLNLSTIEKALMDIIVPLNGSDALQEKTREISKGKSWLNYISTWSFSDVMMITNSFPERKLELANALSMIENSMIVDGKIVNIRQYLKAQDRNKRKNLTYEERRSIEKSFNKRVAELKESSSLTKVAKIENDELIIPGVSDEELAKYRISIIEFSRNLNGQMNNNDKMGYRRDTIFNSFMMFKGWIPKQVSVRGIDIRKNVDLDQWEYGRYRVFTKTLVEIGLRNISDIREVYLGTDKGLSIINNMLVAKKEAYFKKTGKVLEITQEEFQDLIRSQIQQSFKELSLVLGIISLLLAAKAAAPPDDEDALTRNRYKYFMKMTNKISDEILFYVNPASADEMTRGSIIPSLGLLHKVGSLLEALTKEGYYEVTGDDASAEKTHPLKYGINLIPVGAQFQNEILPLIDPELAKEMGIRVTSQSRAR